MNKSIFFFFSVLFPATIFAQNVDQKNKGWYIQPGAFFFNLGSESTTTYVARAEIVGDQVSYTNSLTPGVGLGYFINSKISIYALLPYPPTTDIEGKDAFEDMSVAEVTYAPFALTGNYHLDLGSFEPFIGGGISYTAFLSVDDGDVLDVEAENSFGFVLRAGLDYRVNNTWGVSASVNKMFVSTEYTGLVMVAPETYFLGEFEVTLDPWVYSLGVIYNL